MARLVAELSKPGVSSRCRIKNKLEKYREKRSFIMKKTISALVMSFVLVLSMAVANIAADLNKSFTLTRDSKINGQAVTKGDYSVKYTDDKAGELILLKGKKEIVKAAYKLVPLSVAPSDDKVTYS